MSSPKLKKRKPTGTELKPPHQLISTGYHKPNPWNFAAPEKDVGNLLDPIPLKITGTLLQRHLDLVLPTEAIVITVGNQGVEDVVETGARELIATMDNLP